MRRLTLALLLSFFTVHFLFAQVGEQRTDLSVGLNGGIVLNSVSFNPTIKQKMKVGPTVGITARYICEKYFSLHCGFQGEINFTSVGWKENNETSEKGYQRTIHYVNVPLLASLGYGRERGGLKGFLVVGPQLGFCIGEAEKDGARFYSAQLAGRSDQHDLKVQRKFEYGITGGLGLEFSTKSGHRFIVEGRYFYGLSDIFSNTKKDPFGRSANSTIIAKVSYLFDVKKTSPPLIQKVKSEK